ISQNLKFGTAPSGFLGGTNPAQIGLGVQVADIQKIMTQGALKATGIATDLAIDDGSQARTFFILGDHSGNNIYTRDGSFALNNTGKLFDSSNGFIVQGWMADTSSQVVGPDGSIDFALTSAGPLEQISIELGNLTIAKETTFTDWRGNLNGGGDIADNATVLESDALFDGSSGTLIEASESTLLTNLVRSSTGDNTGNAVDLSIQLGSTITIEALIGGRKVTREFIVGDPPPTGGLTLGDLRDWMQGALGIHRSDAAGEEMISAQRINALTGEATNGTLDQVGAAGFNTLTLSGADYQSEVDAGVGAGVVGPTTIGGVQISDANGNILVAASPVIVNGTGAGGTVTASDLQTALNGLATTNGLTSQFSVSGDTTNGFTIINTEGNSFISADTGSTPIFAAVLASAADPTLGTAQQPLMQAGDTVTFDSFTPIMAGQTMTAVAAGLGNSSNQFEIGATAAETATNLATAINMNSAISGIVTASVVGNQIQLLAKTSGVDGNFTITATTNTANAAVLSTVGVDAVDAVAGDTLDISTDGNAVQSTMTSTVNDVTTLAGNEFLQVNITNMTNSPIIIQLSGVPADVQALAADIIAQIDADPDVIAAGLNGNFSIGANTAAAGLLTGTLEIVSSDNAELTISADPANPADFGTVFATSTSSSSNGIKILLIPQGGAATAGYTGVEVEDSPALTTQAIAAAINSSINANPPLSASAIGSFLRITDNSIIGNSQGNATAGSLGGIVQTATAGFTVSGGSSLVGAGASADTFTQPNSSDFVDGVATAEMIDDETDFTAAGVQVGDFIRFSTGNAAGLIAKITAVGMRTDTTTGTLINDVHALQFEVQSSDSFPSTTVPSAYTIHEAASVDIGVNSTLAAANPPAGLDTASDSGKLRISGHVGTSNAITNVEIKVKTDNSQSVLAGFSEINDAAGESFRSTAVLFDSLGIPRTVDVTYWLESKSNSGTRWRWMARAEDNNVTPGTDIQTVVGTGTINFDTNGRYLADSGDQISIDLDDFGVDEPLVATLNFASLTGFAADVAPDGSVANPTEVFLFNQDGFKAGTLDDFVIASDGKITGLFDNGLTRSLGQLAVARFANPGGLDVQGENYFKESTNSGQAIIGTAGSAGRGLIRSGFLEESNVELAEQFTNLIQQQRAFQANARTITTSDSLLQELVNLVR
ncbi:MAG: flagellar hook-basal body complex protein, partial [Planctomycetaceae bacterium]|nr:flagellar hook-basal body complex protein [Planctomycetaceae bacterium]